MSKYARGPRGSVLKSVRQLIVEDRRLGYTYREIAEMRDVSRDMVAKVLRESGVRGDFLPQHRAASVSQYIKLGLCIDEIVSVTGECAGFVRRVARNEGLSVTRRNRAVAPKAKPRGPRQIKQRAIAGYLSKASSPVSAIELAQATGVGVETARAHARRAGKLKVLLVLNLLTDEQKSEARQLYATGRWTQWGLAEKFGVNQATISRAVRGVEKAKAA